MKAMNVVVRKKKDETEGFQRFVWNSVVPMLLNCSACWLRPNEV